VRFDGRIDGARRISPEEVRQINDGDRIVIRNPW
jgi:hypothetical protein